MKQKVSLLGYEKKAVPLRTYQVLVSAGYRGNGCSL